MGLLNQDKRGIHSKKAFFFSFIAIVILLIFILVFSYDNDENPYTTLYSETSQVQVLTAFTKDLKDVYLERVIMSTSNIAFDVLDNYSYYTGKPVLDPEFRFEEMLINGTFYGNPETLLQNQTLPDWADKISKLADENFRIKTSISFYDVRLFQTDPWLLTVAVDVYIVTNYSNVIYTIGDEISVNISIIGKNDPLHLMYGENRTIIDNFPAEWNYSTLREHIKNKTYTDNTWAPSYLMRMKNDTSNSTCCGIESLMDRSYGDLNLSYVDYLFLNRTYGCHNPSPSVFRPIFKIKELWIPPGDYGEFFKLDEPHLAHYGYHVNDSDVVQICP